MARISNTFNTSRKSDQRRKRGFREWPKQKQTTLVLQDLQEITNLPQLAKWEKTNERPNPNTLHLLPFKKWYFVKNLLFFRWGGGRGAYFLTMAQFLPSIEIYGNFAGQHLNHATSFPLDVIFVLSEWVNIS